MDYLRNLGSAAVSSLVQKSGLTLPFTLGLKVTPPGTIWNLYDGTKREDGSNISIFEYDIGDPSGRKSSSLAKNSLRKLRTTRHPDVLKFIDAVESDTTIYIMTERVRPLASALRGSAKGEKEREEWLIWGLHRISVALAFINDDCSSTHGNLRPTSIFISPSGEWKLGGFELLSNPKDDAAVLYSMGGLLSDALDWAPPEVKKSGWSVLKEQHTSACDAYALGILLHSVFNPTLPLPPTTQPPHPPPQPSSRGAIPPGIFPAYKRLLNPTPKSRLSVKAFLDMGMGSIAGDTTAFFADNQLVKVCMSLDTFNLASEGEKASFLRLLKESAASFPQEFSSFRVLPSLVNALEFGGASAANIIPLLLQLGENASPEEYPTVVLAPLVKLFASPDRGTRMALLDHLPLFSEKIDKKSVTDKIWPHLQTGFTDTIAIIREATVKSIILLAPKFNDRILNNDLLRHLAKLQMDSESSIRTNTCILIGRLGPSLGYNTKRKVLVPAFSRALADAFVHARVAGLRAFMATVDCFDIEDLATKVVPKVAPLMVDKEKLVRDQAFNTIELFIKKLQAHADTMPETVLTEGSGVSNLTSTVPAPGQDTLVQTAAGAAGALAGWAISSISRTLTTSDMKSTISNTDSLSSESASASPQSFLPLGASSSSAANSLQPSPTQVGRTSGGKGMQLGTHKSATHSASATLAAQIAAEIATEQEAVNPWGNDDLMDVNADEDDWTAFETAPVPIVESKPTRITELVNVPPVQAEDSWTSWEEAKHSRQISSGRTSSPLPSLLNHTTSKPSPAPTATASSAVSLSGLSKEEKAAEMARRKEERKQRIAHLKEQKKNATLKTSI